MVEAAMNSLLLTFALVACPETAAAEMPSDAMADVASQLAPELQTGSLLFTQGDCLAVKIFTRSHYTHVAAVVLKDGKPFIYDSTGGVGTRCLTLRDWLETQRPDQIHLYHPTEPFTVERSTQFQAALDERLGRPYAIKHHLTGKRCEGMHCSEYVTDGLIEANLIKAQAPPRVSPASLRKGLLNTELYEPARTIQLTAAEAEVPPEKGKGWCSQLWIDTKVCTANCGTKMRRLFLCR